MLTRNVYVLTRNVSALTRKVCMPAGSMCSPRMSLQSPGRSVQSPQKLYAHKEGLCAYQEGLRPLRLWAGVGDSQVLGGLHRGGHKLDVHPQDGLRLLHQARLPRHVHRRQQVIACGTNRSSGHPAQTGRLFKERDKNPALF